MYLGVLSVLDTVDWVVRVLKTYEDLGLRRRRGNEGEVGGRGN